MGAGSAQAATLARGGVSTAYRFVKYAVALVPWHTCMLDALDASRLLSRKDGSAFLCEGFQALEPI